MEGRQEEGNGWNKTVEDREYKRNLMEERREKSRADMKGTRKEMEKKIPSY